MTAPAQVILAAGVAIVLAGLAVRFLVAGGRARLRFGAMETTLETTIREIHEQTVQINRAVNHQGPDEPALVDRIIAIERLLSDPDTGLAAIGVKLDAHIGVAMAWQRGVAGALPDTDFPDPG